MNNWKFTAGTPARVSLQIIAVGFLGYAIMVLYNAQTAFELIKGVAIFCSGSFLFLLREHVSNSDYFKEFDKHIEEKYTTESEDDEPNGYS